MLDQIDARLEELRAQFRKAEANLNTINGAIIELSAWRERFVADSVRECGARPDCYPGEVTLR